jgi:hypothetical protein
MIATDNSRDNTDGITGQVWYVRVDEIFTGSTLLEAERQAHRRVGEVVAEARFKHEVEEAEKVLKEATSAIKKARAGAWQKPPDFSRPPKKLRNTGRNR